MANIEWVAPEAGAGSLEGLGFTRSQKSQQDCISWRKEEAPLEGLL